MADTYHNTPGMFGESPALTSEKIITTKTPWGRC